MAYTNDILPGINDGQIFCFMSLRTYRIRFLDEIVIIDVQGVVDFIRGRNHQMPTGVDEVICWISPTQVQIALYGPLSF